MDLFRLGFRQFLLQEVIFIPECGNLPFTDRNRPPTVRIRNLNLCQHFGVFLEELGMSAQVLSYVFRTKIHNFKIKYPTKPVILDGENPYRKGLWH